MVVIEEWEERQMEKGMQKKPRAEADLWKLWSMFGASEAIMGPTSLQFYWDASIKIGVQVNVVQKWP